MPIQVNQENFWRLLERRFSCEAIMVEWQKALGDVLPHLQHRYLVPIDEFAQYYPPRDPKGLDYDVIAYPDGTFEAMSSTQDDCISLQPEDLLFHHWNLSLFRNSVARSLGIEPPGDVVKADDRLLQLGHYQLVPGENYPAYWLLTRDRHKFQRDVSALILKIKTPFFVFTGTRNSWVPEMQLTLQENHVRLLALSEVLEFCDGQFVATDVWHGEVEAFRQVMHPENMVAVSPYEFRKRGQKWVVRFAGSEDVYLNDIDGPYYVSMLLANPGKSMHALDMHQIVSKRDPAKTPKELVVAMSDRQTLSDVEKQLRQLLEELDQARRDGDQIVEQETLDEIEKLKQYLAETKGLGGQARNFSDAADNIIRSVRQLIKRTINEIDENLEDCAKHLRNSIKTHSVLYYDPEIKLDWKL